MRHIFVFSVLISYAFSLPPTPSYYNSFDGLTFPGKYGNALYLNNAISYNMNHNATDTNWTITFWCKVDTIHSKYGIFAFGSMPVIVGDSGSYKLKLGTDLDSSGNKNLGLTEPGIEDYDSSSTTPGIPLNEWIHATYVAAGRDISVYLNGNAYSTYSLTEAKTVLQYFGLAAANGGGKYHLDELRVYNTTLTPNEVQELYSMNPTSDNSILVQDSLTSYTSNTLSVGNSLNLSTLITNPKWFSTNSSIATIDSTGILTGISPGTVHIGIMDKDNITIMRTLSFQVSEETSSLETPLFNVQNQNSRIWDIHGKEFNLENEKN